MHDRGKQLTTASLKALRSFGVMVPVLLGVILLLGLFKIFITADMIAAVFTGICLVVFQPATPSRAILSGVSSLTVA